jgi:hypothetical protein
MKWKLILWSGLEGKGGPILRRTLLLAIRDWQIMELRHSHDDVSAQYGQKFHINEKRQRVRSFADDVSFTDVCLTSGL